jgi:hypothetical protein
LAGLAVTIHQQDRQISLQNMQIELQRKELDEARREGEKNAKLQAVTALADAYDKLLAVRGTYTHNLGEIE